MLQGVFQLGVKKTAGGLCVQQGPSDTSGFKDDMIS